MVATLDGFGTGNVVDDGAEYRVCGHGEAGGEEQFLRGSSGQRSCISTLESASRMSLWVSSYIFMPQRCGLFSVGHQL